MMRSKYLLHVLVLGASMGTAAALSGCGTVSSMTHLGRDTPLIYGGTRMDAAAMANDQQTLAKFGVQPPPHPAADLPFSIVGDTLFLPGVLLVAAFRKMFW